MSSLSSNTLPVTQPPSESSWRRLRHRRNVLLPHPEGPMIAVTVLVGKNSETSRTATLRPNSAVSCWVASRTTPLGRVIAAAPRPTGGDGEDEHESHQHQRRGPGEPVPFLVGASPVHEDLQRKGLHRLGDARREVEIAERREQQGGGLAGDAG